MEKLLEEYRFGYQLLRMAIDGLSEEALRFKPEANKWSIHQILIHVADSELVSTQRMKKVLSEEAPLLMSFDQDAWADTLEYEKLDREQHLHLFNLLRSSMLPILEQLPAQKWERVGIYADAGPFTLKQLLEYRVEHVWGHLAQIASVREAYQQSKI
ncbi:DinB family protein [Neobacillus sp. YX16]|uniref:DinB family protein n=1 Tax=Neobacillus sp. YX16 TaxID=3047874 RepID=UPI0024C399E6|nr:DinB family protein [Neobacillus sp. YX16]WHZ02873.1 DinB family protein [Neobacillus sp. YX16]